jgi:hypothetical protein
VAVHQALLWWKTVLPSQPWLIQDITFVVSTLDFLFLFFPPNAVDLCPQKSTILRGSPTNHSRSVVGLRGCLAPLWNFLCG